MRSKIGSDDMVKAQILRACRDGASEARIVNQSGPNTMKVISYLILIDEGLIEVSSVGKRIVHKTTPKGLNQIENLERFHAEAHKLTAKT